MNANQLESKYNPNGDGGEHPNWTREMWRACVAERETILSYWQWLQNSLAEGETTTAAQLDPARVQIGAAFQALTSALQRGIQCERPRTLSMVLGDRTLKRGGAK